LKNNSVVDEEDDEDSIGFFKQNNQKKRERSRSKDKEKSYNSNINQSKSKTHHKPFKRDLCKYFLNGVCTKGDNCTYSHVIKDFPCKYYIIFGNCDNKECR
jgi:uncharacterized protein YaaR (DUF327 family)